MHRSVTRVPDGVGASAGVGMSVVLCCYNAATRLPETLRHLRSQRTGVPWEVVLVDNASTDGTADVARAHWADAPVEMRVVHERTPGLSHARRRGFDEARFEFVAFVDDDNWLAPGWIDLAFATMAGHPEVAACGGRTEAVFESPPPAWFERYQGQFVIGEQWPSTGDITETRGHLWGAGMTLRKQAWESLVARGFRSTLAGRTGSALTSGEDYELCHALRMAGWRLWYEPRLVLQHYMPAARVTWDYLCRLNRGHGVTSCGLDPYERALGIPHRRMVRLFGRYWITEAAKSAAKLAVLRAGKLLRSAVSRSREWPWDLDSEFHAGRLQALTSLRGAYDDAIRRVARAPWRRVGTAATEA